MPQSKVISFTDSVQIGEFVCAIGVFDGLHLGHQYIIGEAINQANSLGLPAFVITFDKDPDELFLPQRDQRKLVSNADRIKLLSSSGVDDVLVLPFTKELAGLEPSTFLNEVIARHGSPRGIHVGTNFHYGYKASGNVDDLKSWGSEHQCEVFAHDLYTAEKLPISSTRIRKVLQEACVEEASKLLGRPHYIRALVSRGRGRGREMGFPTANLELTSPCENILRPADGVYFAVVVVEGKLFKAAVSVGVPSTFDDVPSTIEAHLLDFDGNLYGKSLQVFFCEYLREMRPFDSVDELMHTVQSNIEQARVACIPESINALLECLS